MRLNKIRGYALYGLLPLIALMGGYHGYQTHLNHNFETISKDRFYKSGVIPTNELADYINKHNIKTIIDLRVIGSEDRKLNPETAKQISDEQLAVAEMPQVEYINIPSEQVPDEATVARYLSVIDDESKYPILVHCHHGTGRAVLYSALYQIEKEGLSPEQARQKTHTITAFSNFDKQSPKGKFLLSYQPRSTAH